MELKRLSSHELAIMKAIWAADEPVCRPELESRLDTKWSANTLNTYLTRLAGKGYLECHRMGRGNVYSPCVSEEAYQEFESNLVVNQVFGGSVSALFASLSGKNSLKQEEISELRAYLDKWKEG